MRKRYIAPAISAQEMHLGVYGDYGNDEGGGGPDQPVKIIERFDLRME